MDRRYLEAVTRELATSRSRRQVLGTTGMGVIGGLGAALIARGFDLGLLDGDPAPAARAQGVTVSIQDFEFVPPTIEVPVGSDVTWTNDGDAPHTATALDGATFNSNQLSSGQSFSHTFDTAGTIDYFCAIHGPSMSGTVTVVEAVTPTTTPPEPYVRRNVHNLDEYDATLESYAKAIGIMKGWDLESDVTKWTRSWRYQGNMHMAWDNPAEPPLPNPLPPGWTTCEHSFVAYSPYFWPWHRMYIYWFERIVRELSEDPQFALPYWDYSVAANRILPAPFLDTASQLYIAERDFRVNSGTMPTDPPVPESIFDPCGGMGETDYDFAGSSIEGTPHGGIHVWIGGIFAAPGDPPVEGWMADPTKAARDPIFWLHHANIDRLWESWLALGNANRTDPVWLNNDVNGDNGRLYNFFDEAGAQVTTIRVVSEVLTAAPLGYQYEELFDPVAAGCPAFMMAPPGGDEAAAATPFPTPEAPVELGGSTPAGGIEVGPAPAAVPVTLDQPEVAVANANAGRPTVLTLEGIRGQGVPAVVVEVYINLPAGQEPDSRSPYYVGNLNLFGLLTPHDDVHVEHGSTQRFNIARNVAALEASGEWTGDLQVTLVPFYIASAPEAPGATPEAAAATPVAAPPGPWVTVEGVSVIAR